MITHFHKSYVLSTTINRACLLLLLHENVIYFIGICCNQAQYAMYKYNKIITNVNMPCYWWIWFVYMFEVMLVPYILATILT